MALARADPPNLPGEFIEPSSGGMRRWHPANVDRVAILAAGGVLADILRA
jgi:hypothetical protein